ncbi:hypothetical protein B0T14DRAFT_280495 [Immersiella caudata]|uniref:Uncharacterized protein n=1 Tax=Immersiella caudata TaxID=314043 RepID=A0AA40BTX2_9PEZI|nr:hypothetical protein B0T14DRAFT_280495 [Immersiella caudata]
MWCVSCRLPLLGLGGRLAYHLSDGNSYRAIEKPIRRRGSKTAGRAPLSPMTTRSDHLRRPLGRGWSLAAQGGPKIVSHTAPSPLSCPRSYSHARVPGTLPVGTMQARPAMTNARPAPGLDGT